MGITAERFIGQASRKDDRGMSQREQKEVLDRFSRGSSTSSWLQASGRRDWTFPKLT